MTNNPDDEAELELPYEEAFDHLEQILQALESGDLPLEEALSLYEQGAMLAAHCARLLDEAELRVEQWQPNGSTMPLVGWQES